MTESSQVERWRRRTLEKLGGVCDGIARLKAGEAATLATIPVPGGGGDAPVDPLARLEWYKDRLNATLRALADGSHGRCGACGEPIPAEQLDGLPWADVCADCAGQGRT